MNDEKHSILLRLAKAIAAGADTKTLMHKKIHANSFELNRLLDRMRSQGWIDSTHASVTNPARYRMLVSVEHVRAALEAEIRGATMDATALLAAMHGWRTEQVEAECVGD